MFYITPFPLCVEKDLKKTKKAQCLVGPSNILCWLRLRCGGFSESSILYMKLFSCKIYQDLFGLSRPLCHFVRKGGKMGGWTLITNHGMVLSYLARRPRSTAREVAQAIGITERTTHKIIADLAREGYISRRREGRGNVYRVNPRLPLRHPTHGEVVVGDLLIALGWRPRARKLAPPA